MFSIRFLCTTVMAFILFSGNTSLVFARDIKIATVEWPPYYGASLKNGGVLTDIVTAAFTHAGHKTSIQFVPLKRVLYDLKKGEADIAMGITYSAENEQDFFYSEPFYSSYIGLIALKKSGIKEYTSVDVLNQYKIGMLLGFDLNVKIEADVGTSNLSNIFKLCLGRVDMIGMPIDVFKYEIEKIEHQTLKRLGIDHCSINDVVFVYPPLTRHSIHVAVSKKIKDHQMIIEDFNRGLMEIKSQGIYLEILERHGF